MNGQLNDHSHHEGGYSRAGMVSAIFPLLLFAGLCLTWPRVIQGEVFSVGWTWLPALDVTLRFRLDGLSLLFGVIVTGIGFLVTLFAARYMVGHPHAGRFFAFLQGFMAAMLGIITPTTFSFCSSFGR